jgi:hypothetical protein
MDADQAGQEAAEQISGLSQAVKCVQVPQGKDMNGSYLMAGQADVDDWIKASLE